MQGRRNERVAELIREELGLLLLRRVKDPTVQGVTITDVRVTPDLTIATAYFAAKDTEVEGIRAGLERAAAFLRKELGKKLRLKKTPQLRFQRDEAIEQGEHIDALLKKLSTDAAGEEQ